MCRTRSGEGVARCSGDLKPRRFLAAGASSGGSTTSFRRGPAGPTRPASPFRSDGGSDRRRPHCLHALDRRRLARPEAAPGPRRARRREHLDLTPERGARDRRRQQPARGGARPGCRGRARSHLRREPALACRPPPRRRGASERRPRAVGDLPRRARRRPSSSRRRLPRLEPKPPLPSSARCFPRRRLRRQRRRRTLLPLPRRLPPGRRSPRSHLHQLRARRSWSSPRLRRSARSSAGRTPSRPSPAPDCR